MKKITSLLFLSLLIFLTMTAQASELFGKISYKGSPLKDAEITAGDKKIKTNGIGYYSVTLNPGSHTLSIKLPDGTVKNQKVDVFAQDTEKNLKLE